MPELAELLKSAQPAGAAGFDAADVHRRVGQRARRRRTAGAATLAGVAMLVVTVTVPRLLPADDPGAVLGSGSEQAATPGDPASPDEAGSVDADLRRRAADAGYRVEVRDALPPAVTFTPVDPADPDGPVTARTWPAPTPGGPEDLDHRDRLSLMFRAPVWATAQGEPLADCGSTRIAGPPGSAYDRLVERMDCTPAYVVDPATAALPGDQALLDVLVRLVDAGHIVRHVVVVAGTPSFDVVPLGPGLTPVHVQLRPTTEPPSVSPFLVPLGAGLAREESGGMLAFDCGGVSVATTGPGAGGSELEAVAELPAALGCTPTPAGLTPEQVAEAQALAGADGSAPEDPAAVQDAAAREARISEAVRRLSPAPGSVNGEPAHGGPTHLTFRWEDAEVMLTASAPVGADPEFQAGRLVDLAGGTADAGDHDGLPGVSFDCGPDHLYLAHDSVVSEVHVRAAAALAAELGCTPETPWAG